MKQVEDILTMKKELTSKASLFYLPNQQIRSTLSPNFKMNEFQISDRQLIDTIESMRQKSYYKSAEMFMISEPKFKKS